MIEYRDFHEIRAEGDGNTIVGWGTRFGEPADIGYFNETITRGAFAKTLKAQAGKVRLLAGHNPGALPVGTITSLEERDAGLWMEASIADTATGRDILALAKGGHPIGLSIGFSVPDGGESWSNDRTNRTLNEIRLHEISVVGAPAYDNADVVGVRSFENFLTAAANLRQDRVGKKLSAASAGSIKAAIEALSGLLESETAAADVDEENAAKPVEIDLDTYAAKAASVLADNAAA